MEVLIQIPGNQEEGRTSAQIEGNRLSFNGAVPKALQPYLSAVSPIKPGDPAWFELMLSEDRDDLIDAEFRITELTADTKADPDSENAAATAHRWIRQPRLPFHADELIGSWRVRSLQGGAAFHTLYPYFDAEFRNENGRAIFQKSTGSQRRMGWVLPDRSDRMIFLGARTVNEDPPLQYSRLDPKIPITSPRAESDSWGFLIRIGKNQYLMVMDVSAGQSYELYELIPRRP